MEMFSNSTPDHQVLIGLVAQSLGISELEVTDQDVEAFCAHTGWSRLNSETESLLSKKE
jgi:hypothetical protein